MCVCGVWCRRRVDDRKGRYKKYHHYLNDCVWYGFLWGGGEDGEHRFVNSCGGEEASKGNGIKSNLHYHTHITLRSHKWVNGTLLLQQKKWKEKLYCSFLLPFLCKNETLKRHFLLSILSHHHEKKLWSNGKLCMKWIYVFMCAPLSEDIFYLQ